MKDKTIDNLIRAAGALDDAVFETHAKDCAVSNCCPLCAAWDDLARANAEAKRERRREQDKQGRHAKALAESAAARLQEEAQEA